MSINCAAFLIPFHFAPHPYPLLQEKAIFKSLSFSQNVLLLKSRHGRNIKYRCGIPGKLGYFLQGVKMKRVLLPLFLSFLFSISFALASFAEGNRTITILFTGSVKGTLDPCAV
jgi:hypothetical protein